MLSLDNTQVTDAGLQHLSHHTHLWYLSLGNTEVTDVGLQHLIGLTNIQGLTLAETQVTDAGLPHLSRHANLFYLSLRDTQVTDAGLQHLTGLTSLQFIDVEVGTQITAEAALEFESRIPGCSVDASMTSNRIDGSPPRMASPMG